MSGFKDDVISILRDNVLLHGEALGWIITQHTIPESSELYKELQDRKFPVTNKLTKPVIRFDYIIIPKLHLTITWFLKALEMLAIGGMIIMDVTGYNYAFDAEYKIPFGSFTARKLIYGDRIYMVVHSGVDYAN